MPQHGTEASLSPAAGTSCAAACIAFDVHHQPLRFHTKVVGVVVVGVVVGVVVVVVWWWLCDGGCVMVVV